MELTASINPADGQFRGTRNPPGPDLLAAQDGRQPEGVRQKGEILVRTGYQLYAEGQISASSSGRYRMLGRWSMVHNWQPAGRPRTICRSGAFPGVVGVSKMSAPLKSCSACARKMSHGAPRLHVTLSRHCKTTLAHVQCLSREGLATPGSFAGEATRTFERIDHRTV